MDESHFLAAVRYAELNPVRAELVKHAENWRWSSAKAHIEGLGDKIVEVNQVLKGVGDWKSFLEERTIDNEIDMLKKHSRTGRPLGNKNFVSDIEVLLKRSIQKNKSGPKKKNAGN